jgi:hypothetical protein
MQRIRTEKAMTSIRVKLSTRNMVRELSLPGESMDDTIVRIVNENASRSKEIEKLETLLDHYNIKERNIITFGSQERAKDMIQTDGFVIEFSYNIPKEEDNEYRMDIVIERAVKNDHVVEFNELGLEKKANVMIYFKMIERIINEHFDRGFSLPLNRNLMDPEYWKKIWKRVNLSDSSYLNDILKIMNEE